MNSKKHKLPRRLLAMLLAICMFVTMFPSGTFATEQQPPEGDNIVVQNDDQETLTNDENDSSETQEPDTPPVGTEQSYTITPSMTQEEVNQAVKNATGPITVKAGDYGIEGENNHIKINLSGGNQTIQLEPGGQYNRLMIVVLSEGNVLEANGATVDGDVDTVYNQSPMIYIPYGSLELQGELSIVDHDYGVILGYTNATNENATLTLAENAILNISQCKTISGVNGNSSYDNGIVCSGTEYFSNVDTQGDGTRGSAITTKGKYNENNYTSNEVTTSIIVCPGAKLNATNNSGAGVFSVNVKNFTLDIQQGAEVDLSNNGQGICMNTDFTSSVNVNVDAATLTINDNSSNGITGQAKPYILDIKNGSTVNVDRNGGIGINNFYIKLDNSDLSVSNSGSHGATNVAFDATNGATAAFDNNTYIGLNITKYNSKENDEQITEILNSTVQANNNGGPGIRFLVNGGDGTSIKNSKVTANNNGNAQSTYGWSAGGTDQPSYWAGIVGAETVTLENSTVISDSLGGYGHYDRTGKPAKLYIDDTDVVAFDSDKDTSNQDIADDWNSNGYTGRTYVMGGSLQAEFDQMKKGIDVTSINSLIPEVKGNDASKSEVQYTAPINDNNTALTRFNLHQDVDKGSSLTTNPVAEGEKQTYLFQVWDPNSSKEMTKAYDYTFRYNEAGEDLDGEDVSGNAYVWTPVTMIRYDATEGTIVTDGSTVQTKQGNDWSLKNTRGDQTELNYDVEEDYIDAVDYTICGNSLALSEGSLPNATKDGQTFAGWYYAVGEENVETAASYAESGEYTNLYNLLLTSGKKFNANTLTSDDDVDVEEITLYAVWTNTITITPADITIYMGGDKGYEAVVDGSGSATTTNSLPKPLFLIEIGDGYDPENLTFTNATNNKSWTVEQVGTTKINGKERGLYELIPSVNNTDPVRVQYIVTDAQSGESSAIISDTFEPRLEEELFKDYGIELYYGENNQEDIQAAYTDESKTQYFSVKSERGILRVRAVDDTEDNNNPVHTIQTGATGTPIALDENAPAAISAPEGTTYTLNNTTVSVDAAGVGLLFDNIINDDGHNRTQALINKIEETDQPASNVTRHYQAQYLDLVDAHNGNAWVKASGEVTITWAYPEGTNQRTDFTLYHFPGLHRDNADNGLSGFDIADVTSVDPENVEIQTTAEGITFTVPSGGFSPFVLVWETSNGGGGTPGTTPGDDDKPETPALNTEDHYLYIEGYPEDYRTGEYSDDESLWPVKPQNNITRAEVATIFYRLLKDEVRDEIETTTNNFTDVNEGDWFNVTVSSLANMDVLQGYGDGTFRPNDPITRAELSAIAVRFFENFEAIYAPGTFTDVTGDEWYADAIAAAEELGILAGYPDGTVRPESNITRAETCAIVNRVLDRRPHEDHLGTVDEMRTWPDNLLGAWYYADMQEATNGHYYDWITIDGTEFEEWTEVDKDYDWTKR